MERKRSMKTEILRVTQKLDVIDADPENPQKDVFFSRVEDVGEDNLFIMPPFRKGAFLPPLIGRVVIARVVSDKVPYLFEATLLRYMTEQIPLWEVTKPLIFNKIQLREDVRLEIGLKVSLEVLKSGDERKIIQTLTKDLSASGMQVVLPKALSVGTIVRINVILGSEFLFATHGTIIRLVPPMPPVDKYFAGIKFSEVDEPTKKKIIRYIFGKQTEMRMKERELFS
jgi:c-di-GMP-binding flagellar brake protein YcgR